MATNKPRITITLDPKTYNVLKVISDSGDKTMSGFVAELLDAAMPTLERMAVTFQAIRNAQEVERQKFLSSIDRAQAAVEPAVMHAVGQFDLFLSTIEKSVTGENTSERSEEGVSAVADSNPRLVTRGSTPLPRKNSAASKPAPKAGRRARSGGKL